MATEMQVSSGFFDSLQGSERRYTADEFSSIFDGLISDGVYENYPGNNVKPFAVTPATSGFNINIGPGRAWFHHVWVLNDSTIQLTIDPPHTTYSRKDTVLIKVDKLNRSSYILVSKGEPSSSPDPTIPENNVSDGIYYYPIAYVTVPISAGRAEYCWFVTTIGAGKATPLVKAIVQPSMDFSDYVQDYDNQVSAQIQNWESLMLEQFQNPTVYDHAMVAQIREKVEEFEESTVTSEEVNSKIENFRQNQVAPISNRVSAIEDYYNTSFAFYKGKSTNINKPPKTICKMMIGGENKVAGPLPTTNKLGTSILLISMNPDPSGKGPYNFQIAVGLTYNIGFRLKHAGTWDPWRYLSIPAK